MTQSKKAEPMVSATKPKWFAPAIFALAFTLSYIGAESFGPIGAVLGLVLGGAIGWAAARWLFKAKADT